MGRHGIASSRGSYKIHALGAWSMLVGCPCVGCLADVNKPLALARSYQQDRGMSRSARERARMGMTVLHVTVSWAVGAVHSIPLSSASGADAASLRQ